MEKTDNTNETVMARRLIIEGGIITEYRLYRRRESGVGEIYSLELTTEYDGETERGYADGISVCREEAVKIFDMMLEGEVTSCAMLEVLEDLLAE